MTTYNNAANLATAVGEHIKHEWRLDEEFRAEIKVHQFTPSILVTRGFLGVEVGDKQYLITVEEA